MARLRSGSRTMGGPMNFVVSTPTRISDDLTLPPDRYAGTVEWEERMLRSGFERSKKRYKLRIEPGDVAQWSGQGAAADEACLADEARLVDITAQVASGEIGTL